MCLKVKRISKVEYVIDMDKKPDKIRFLWKKGQLYLSVEGIVLNSDETWYEIPSNSIRDVLIDESGLLIVDFDTGDIKILSKDINSLRAMRHFLLPYVRG